MRNARTAYRGEDLEVRLADLHGRIHRGAYRAQPSRRVWIPNYADDAVLGFQYREDADRFRGQVQGRLRQFGMELHPDKTRLIEFGRYAAERRKKRGEGKPETFHFPGFTHIGGRSPQNGYFTVVRQTIGKRMAAQTEGYWAEAATADAGVDREYGEVAERGGSQVFPVPRCTGERGAKEGVPE